MEDDALRNKIRHHVVPLLESINPAASENIALSAKYIRQAKSILESMDSISITDSYRKVIYIPKVSVMNAPSPEFILHKELGRYGFMAMSLMTSVKASSVWIVVSVKFGKRRLYDSHRQRTAVDL